MEQQNTSFKNKILQNKKSIIKILNGAAIFLLLFTLIFNIYDISFWGVSASANGFSIIFQAAEAIKDLAVWLALVSIAILATSIILAVIFVKNLKNEELSAKFQKMVCILSLVFTFVYMIDSFIACGKFNIQSSSAAWLPFVFEIIVCGAIFSVNRLKIKE